MCKPVTLFTLEELRERKLHDVVSGLQGSFRAYRARKRFLELREKSKGIFNGRKRRRGSCAPLRRQGSSDPKRTPDPNPQTAPQIPRDPQGSPKVPLEALRDLQMFLVGCFHGVCA